MKTISLCLFYHIQHSLGKDELEMSKYILSKLQVSQQLSWGKDLLHSAGPGTSAPDHQEVSATMENQIPIQAARQHALASFLVVTLALLQGSLGPRGRTQLKMLRGRCMGLKESFLVNGKVLKLSGNAPSWVLEWQWTQKASKQPPRRRKTAVVLCLQLPGGWHRGRKAKYNFQLRYKTYLKVHR